MNNPRQLIPNALDCEPGWARKELTGDLSKCLHLRDEDTQPEDTICPESSLWCVCVWGGGPKEQTQES